MEMVRLLAQTHSSRRRGVVLFVMLSALIVGLLGMHILSMSPSHNSHSVAPPTGLVDEHQKGHLVAGSGSVADIVVLPGAAIPSATAISAISAFSMAGCEDGCNTPSPLHSMVMMTCVLALFVGVLIILAPRPLRFSRRTLTLAVRSLEPIGAVLLRPHPPSLIVLSISRT